MTEDNSRLADAVRYTLGSILAFGALNAFAGGIYGLAGAKDIPREWLRGSPFVDYLVPSVVLVAVVGGSFLLAAIAVFARWRRDGSFALAAGVIVLGWLAIEIGIIGYVSWMQPATAVGGGLVVALALRLGPASPRARLRRRTA